MPIFVDDLDLMPFVRGLRITALYAAAFIAILIVLTVRVIRLRRANRVGLGDGGNTLLLRAVRAHANFCETVPPVMLAMIVLALLGARPWVLHLIGGLLLLGRLAHATGISQASGSSLGRVGGMALTLTALGAAALALVVFALR